MKHISGHTKISGVIGENISYTKSPLIHNYWYSQHQIDGAYLCFNTSSERFKETVYGLFYAGIIGLNVTVPFKELAFDFAHIRSDAAEQAQSVNCLTFKDNQIYGHNTDGIGFYNALKYLDPKIDLNNKEILIIGAGGAASAIIAYLSQFNVKIYILNRTLSKAEDLVNKFSSQVVIQAVTSPLSVDLIVQTTNLKTIETGSIIDIPDDIMQKSYYIIDINYGDGAGEFLKRASKLGIKNCDGSEMLLQQAVPAFEFFNNQPVEITDNLRNLLKNS